MTKFTSKFKIGDRVKIPTKKTTTDVILEDCGLIKEYKKMEIKPRFCYIIEVFKEGKSYIIGFDQKEPLSQFYEEDLEFYDKLEDIKEEVYKLLEIDK